VRLVTLGTTIIIITHEFPAAGASPGIPREVIQSNSTQVTGLRGARENTARSKAGSICLAPRNHHAGRIPLPAEPFGPLPMCSIPFDRPCAADRHDTGGASLLLAERTMEGAGSKKRGQRPFVLPISLNGVNKNSGRM
jgi:hypothetical protein